MSLREKKKQLTRERIASAAFQLVEERGLSDLTLEDIAALAFVSARTVSNYFPSKEAAVVHRDTTFWGEILEGYASHPAAATTPLLALRDLSVTGSQAFTAAELLLERRRQALIVRHPALRRHELAQYDEVGAVIREVVARTTRTDPERSMHPHLVAGAAVVAVHAALTAWARPGVPLMSLPEHIADAFDHATDGLPAPRSSLSA
jgi:AcrR family transcriptional regulator